MLIINKFLLENFLPPLLKPGPEIVTRTPRVKIIFDERKFSGHGDIGRLWDVLRTSMFGILLSFRHSESKINL